MGENVENGKFLKMDHRILRYQVKQAIDYVEKTLYFKHGFYFRPEDLVQLKYKLCSGTNFVWEGEGIVIDEYRYTQSGITVYFSDFLNPVHLNLIVFPSVCGAESESAVKYFQYLDSSPIRNFYYLLDNRKLEWNEVRKISQFARSLFFNTPFFSDLATAIVAYCRKEKSFDKFDKFFGSFSLADRAVSRSILENTQFLSNIPSEDLDPILSGYG